jgi:hypothetical protein
VEWALRPPNPACQGAQTYPKSAAVNDWINLRKKPSLEQYFALKDFLKKRRRLKIGSQP